MDHFSTTLKEKLSNEGIELAVSAGTIDVPAGHLAVVLTLSSSNSLPDQRLRAERIVNDEFIRYLQDSGKAVK
jgi:hypothetical protein